MSASGPARVALLVTHTGRSDIVDLARLVIGRLGAAGFEVRVLDEEAGDLHVEGVRVVAADDCAADDAEIVLVLGGDGTFLRAAELARPTGAGLLGVNLGRVGFLAEAEPEALDDTIARVVDKHYDVEERLTIDVTVQPPDGPPVTAWALNEASVEKSAPERMIEVSIEIDDHPLTSFGCDGVLFATPTGSTAYAFSAGGPVAWPSVEALVVVPNNAHALFARPLVTSAGSVLAVRLLADGHDAVLCCDGRRTLPVPPGSRVEVRRGVQSVRIVRVHSRVFTDRLVAKFALPVKGFRDRRR
ncbi:MAG TPA: NAD kinase [Mycobacteriales bacterium]|jgi:NAD+ kinase